MENILRIHLSQRKIVTITSHNYNHKGLFVCGFENSDGEGFPLENSLN